MIGVGFCCGPRTKAKNQRPRLFLDLFAGVNAPLTQAMHRLGVDYFEPSDLDRDPKYNILDDSVFNILMRAAWSGLIGVVWAAPPCKEFSRLKLCPGGPKALRTPEFMDGVPNLTAEEQARVDASAAIHQRSLSLHDLLVDEPPAIEVNNSNMGLGVVRNFMSVHDTALAMVGSAHLACLKALNLCFLRFMSQRFEAESHLRASTVFEA